MIFFYYFSCPKNSYIHLLEGKNHCVDWHRKIYLSVEQQIKQGLKFQIEKKVNDRSICTSISCMLCSFCFSVSFTFPFCLLLEILIARAHEVLPNSYHLVPLQETKGLEVRYSFRRLLSYCTYTSHLTVPACGYIYISEN